MTETINQENSLFDKLKIYNPSPTEILKNRYIKKNEYLKKSFEKMTIERDTIDIDEIYNDIRSRYHDEDETNPRYAAELTVYENEKDFFFLERDMRFSWLMLAFHTFEKDLKKFLSNHSKTIKTPIKTPINIQAQSKKPKEINEANTYDILNALSCIYDESFKEVFNKIHTIRELVNAFKHNENKAKKDYPNFFRTLDIFDKEFINYEDSVEKFLYITKDELFDFIDHIIKFWNEIPILKNIDSEDIYNKIKEKKTDNQKIKNKEKNHKKRHTK